MPPLSLPSGLSYCVIDATAVFLDIVGDRYFLLSPAINRAFLSWVDGSGLSDRQVSALEGAGVLTRDDSRPTSMTRVGPTPLGEAAAILSGPFDIAALARALWMQRRTERRLYARGLSTVLADLARLRTRSNCLRPHLCEEGSHILRAFEVARLLRPSARACLPRSIAVALCLARHRIYADVVLGVRINPFAAHCWAQARGEVLNDSLGEVSRFTPILVA